MIHIKRIELFREFQKNIMTMVQHEALMCDMKEYAVSVRNHHTEVTIFIHRYSVTLIFYISGRVVIQILDSKTNTKEIVFDKWDGDYYTVKSSVADLASRYIFELFNEALKLRQRWRSEYRERYNERINTFAAAVNDSIKEV